MFGGKTATEVAIGRTVPLFLLSVKTEGAKMDQNWVNAEPNTWVQTWANARVDVWTPSLSQQKQRAKAKHTVFVWWLGWLRWWSNWSSNLTIVTLQGNPVHDG
jgi:hypothetical protein